jgi:glycosyltransferase involved in cell wall biosynthesis
MSENLQHKIKKLLVVSDTALYSKFDSFYGFGPVVKELESFDFVNQITWIGFGKKFNQSFVDISDNRIRVIILPETGGKSILSKFKIIAYYPLYFFIILKETFKVNHIHVRAPSNPAVIAMLLSYIFPTKKFWFKYAGNWVGEASFFYKCQRRILKHLFRNAKITVNGSWKNKSKNIISFENPCLDGNDRLIGKEVVFNKKLNDKPILCFVGNLNENKGVKLLIDAIKKLPENTIKKLHIVGGGELYDFLDKESLAIKTPIKLHGFIEKQKIAAIYKEAHFMVLPSKSEGFPKVIGEAMNYGCIPIVSNISCIGQYVKNNNNGILIDNLDSESVLKAIIQAQKLDYHTIINTNYKNAKLFTYDYYNLKIMKYLFNK